MLVATKNTVFAWPGGPDQSAPAVIVGDATVHAVAEGTDHHVIALDSAVWLETREGTQRLDAAGVSQIESALILEERPLRVLFGTDEAHLYELADADSSLVTRIESFEHLPCRKDWYTPWGGPPAVRSLAASSDGQTVYADIHVGSIMRSTDGGESWEPVTPELDIDVHQVTTSVAAPDRVYANTASAVFMSDDCGQSWQHRSESLDNRYGRAIAAHPEDPDCLLASVSNGPRGGKAQLFRTEDAGQHWQHVTNGFPSECDRNIDTFHIDYGPDGVAWAAVEKVLFRSTDRGETWKNVWEAAQRILSLSCGRTS